MDGAWAGGRSFKKQPYLTVADAGGAKVTKDSTTMVTASITPSLMVRKAITCFYPYGKTRIQRALRHGYTGTSFWSKICFDGAAVACTDRVSAFSATMLSE